VDAGNAIHPALDFGLTPADGPVLDYRQSNSKVSSEVSFYSRLNGKMTFEKFHSGGAGNNVILLASSGIKCVYFGIGLLEFAFAEYRVRRLGLQNMVIF